MTYSRGTRVPISIEAASDIYSIGILVYELMTEDEKVPKLLDEQYRTETPLSPLNVDGIYIHEEYSEELRDLVKQCLHFDFRKRPTPADLLSRTSAARDLWAKKPDWKFGKFEFASQGPDGKPVESLYATGRNILDLELNKQSGHEDIAAEPLYAQVG